MARLLSEVPYAHAMFASDLDRLLDTYFAPALSGAGFEGQGRIFWLKGETGNLVAVEVTPWQYALVGFHIEWAIVPSALRSYWLDSDPHGKPKPQWGALRTRLEVPTSLRQKPFLASLWAFDPAGDTSVFGLALRSALETEAIPRWRLATTSSYIETAKATDPDLISLSTPTGLGSPVMLRALLHVDEVSREQAASLVEAVAERLPDKPIVNWLRERVANRET